MFVFVFFWMFTVFLEVFLKMPHLSRRAVWNGHGELKMWPFAGWKTHNACLNVKRQKHKVSYRMESIKKNKVLLRTENQPVNFFKITSHSSWLPRENSIGIKTLSFFSKPSNWPMYLFEATCLWPAPFYQTLNPPHFSPKPIILAPPLWVHSFTFFPTHR